MGKTSRLKRRPTPRSRGFSLLEAMISAAVLGFALVGVVQLHTSSVRGTARAEDIGRAAEIARQMADQTASLSLLSLAACGNDTTPLDVTTPPGCRASFNLGRVLTNPKTGTCTQEVTDDATPDGSGALLIAPTTAVNPYRIDIAVAEHPSGADGLAIVHVWVCWRDGMGFVNEVHTSRTRVAGI